MTTLFFFEECALCPSPAASLICVSKVFSKNLEYHIGAQIFDCVMCDTYYLYDDSQLSGHRVITAHNVYVMYTNTCDLGDCVCVISVFQSSPTVHFQTQDYYPTIGR